MAIWNMVMMVMMVLQSQMEKWMLVRNYCAETKAKDRHVACRLWNTKPNRSNRGVCREKRGGYVLYKRDSSS